MRIGIPSLAFDRDRIPNIENLGINLSKIPTVNPTSIKRIPASPPPELVEMYNQVAPSTSLIEQAVQQAISGINSPDFSNTGTAEDAPPPMLPMVEPEVTPQTPPPPPPRYVEPLPGESFFDFAQRVKEFYEQNPELKPIPSMVDPGPRTPPVRGTSVADVVPMVEPEVTPMDSDIDRAVAEAIASAIASGGDIPIQAADDPIPTIDPVQAAVDAAVGNGQPTTDDTILQDNRTERPTGGNNPNLEAFLNSQMYKDFVNRGGIGTMDMYTASDGTEFGSGTVGKMYEKFLKEQAASQPNTGTDTGTETPAQPDFMTQLNELIASMQAEQTAAAEQAAAAEQQRQEQVAAMTQNYMVGQPAVGYNPYESGQYQSDPYGAAGVPAMGGITTIPVPAAYNPNPYPIGGTT